MKNVVLYADDNHKFILLNESEPGEEQGIRSNQYLVMRGEEGILLDPGGFGVMPQVLTELFHHIEPDNIKGIFLSHQDPDIVGGLSTWLELTPAKVYVSRLWMRFLPHYGRLNMHRFVPLGDDLEDIEPTPGFRLRSVPAHFLHSPGQLNLFDPVSSILFSGDIGAALIPEEEDYAWADDFDRHLRHIEGFHRRYMANNRALRYWVSKVRPLHPHMIASQHGPIYRGESVTRLLDWLWDLPCGADLLEVDGGAGA